MIRAFATATIRGPISILLAAALLVPALAGVRAQEENLLDRISNERLIAFERKLEDDIDRQLRRYLAPGQYVLSVRVIWDRNLLPPASGPGLTQEKYKLPGVPIFVRPPGAPPDEQVPPVTRIVVKMLIDETLPDYYERFLRKIVPIVARFVPDRGDQLVILKETFPELNREELMPPLSEEELMGAAREAAPPAPIRRSDVQGQGTPIEQARLAYDEGRYPEALEIVRDGFQQARTNRERAQFLGMEGSIHYTMNNLDAARSAWERALGYNPNDPEIQRALNFMGQRPSGSR